MMHAAALVAKHKCIVGPTVALDVYSDTDGVPQPAALEGGQGLIAVPGFIAVMENDLLTSVLEQTPDAVIITSPTGVIKYWNAAAGVIFGYTPAEALGQRLHELLPPASGINEPDISSANIGSNDTIVYQNVRHRKDGTLALINTSRKVVFGAEAQARYVLYTTKDVTTLEVQRDARLRSSEFLANMSHELRTPLSGIIGFSEFLADQKAGPLNEKQQEYLHDVLASGHHLLRLINDVLDLSKADAGRIELCPETFSVPQAVSEVHAALAALAHERRIDLTRDVSAGARSVHLDRRRFIQVLHNLMAHALKFTGDGGRVALTIGLAGPSLLQITVSDSGMGVRPEDVPRLFGEFQKLAGAAGRGYEGTGLGLALTKRLVELQGGTISVSSEYGRGSTFVVDLPFAPAESITAELPRKAGIRS
jgi:protein-histidine pros-kinase